jgi:hypothetical protein
MPATDVVLGAIASRTTHIHLGSAVTVLSSNDLVWVFQRYPTLDAVSPPRDGVARAMTDPELVSLSTAVGRGGRPEGFESRVGCRFRFVGNPVPGWDGIVRCEVLDPRAPELLSYSWQGSEGARPTRISYRLEPWRTAIA